MSTQVFGAQRILRPSGMMQSLMDDPLSRALLPPPDETPEQSAERVQRQQQAREKSKAIDEAILRDTKAWERKKKAIKILLLGQAESGKSTVLKNFQLTFAPDQLRRECRAWRVVIQLNLISSVKKLLEVISSEFEHKRDATRSPPSSPRMPTAPESITDLTDHHLRLRMALSPLLNFESTFSRKLLLQGEIDPSRVTELAVRSGSDWQAILEQMTQQRTGNANGSGSSRQRISDRLTFSTSDDPATILAACRDNIITLWNDPVLRGVLQKKSIDLSHSSGFFLDDTARVADVNYMPTDDDLVRARLRTYGVQEHCIMMEEGRAENIISVRDPNYQPGPHKGREWYIYDVGGARSMRNQWVPYFDDMSLIIFLAPISFDSTLEEAPTVNRLQDTVELWQSVCGNPLLAHSNIILFFNKMDILEARLKAGVKVKDYVAKYGDLPNELNSVMRYFKDKFRMYHKKASSKPRPFHCHMISAIDTKAMRTIVLEVFDSLLRGNLERTAII